MDAGLKVDHMRLTQSCYRLLIGSYIPRQSVKFYRRLTTFVVIGTARIVCGAGLGLWNGTVSVRLSTRLSVPAWAYSSKPSAVDLLLLARQAGSQAISIDCCSSGVRRANAGSATLSVYVGSWTHNYITLSQRRLRLVPRSVCDG